MILRRSLAALSVVLVTTGCAPPGTRLQAKAAEPLRHAVRVDSPLNASVSYLQSGDAKDGAKRGEKGVRIIFVHGTPGSANGWVDYVLEPPPGTEVLALDRPGFGESGPDEAVSSLAAQARAVVALLPADGRKAVLVGHSLGGAVVAQVAADHPQRVQALVLLASSLDPAQEKIHPLQPIGRMWPINAMLSRTMRNANEELMLFKAELDALQPVLHRITAPTIIVHGTLDDLVPFANVAYMQAQLTGVKSLKTVVLEGQNHFLPWNSEAQVREAVQWAVDTKGTTL
jgi:pimeloyl-ACP methyl ester carboxylesterase